MKINFTDAERQAHEQQREVERAARRNQYAKLLQADINSRGMFCVLTDMLLAPQEYKNKLWYGRPENHLRKNGVAKRRPVKTPQKKRKTK